MPPAILLIDDDELSRELLGLLLEGEGFAVSALESGDAALAYVRGGTVPEVVLADMQMPGTTGSELAMALRQACGPRAVLMAMSASRPVEEVLKGFDCFLLKPFSGEEFSAELARLFPRIGRNGTVAGAARGAGAETARDLDEGIYLKLAEIIPAEQLDGIYRFALEDLRSRVETMRACAGAGDGDGFRRQAHAIKGSCSMLGASRLAQIVTEMEQWPDVSVDTANAALDEFLAASVRLEVILLVPPTDKAQNKSDI